MSIEKLQKEWWWIPVSIVVTGVIAVMLPDALEPGPPISLTPPDPSIRYRAEQRRFDPGFYEAHMTRVTAVREALSTLTGTGGVHPLREPPDAEQAEDGRARWMMSYHLEESHAALRGAWVDAEESRLWARLGYPDRAIAELAKAERYLETGLGKRRHMTTFEITAEDLVPNPLWDPDTADGRIAYPPLDIEGEGEAGE